MLDFWLWITELIGGFTNAWEWLTTPLLPQLGEVLGLVTTPLALIGMGGLTAYIAYAIIRWIGV